MFTNYLQFSVGIASAVSHKIIDELINRKRLLFDAFTIKSVSHVIIDVQC